MTLVDLVLQVFEAIDLRPELARAAWLPLAGIRLRRDADPFPVDVFPSLDERYAEVERRCERHPFGREGIRLPFLSAEDLTGYGALSAWSRASPAFRTSTGVRFP